MAKSDQTNGGDGLGKILSYLVAVTTILGVPIALYGYFVGQQASRVDRTFNFYEDFRNTSLQNDVNLLIAAWNKKKDDAQKLFNQNDSNGLAQLAESLLKDDQTNAALVRVVTFYDGIGSCIAHSLCDENAAIALLKDPADQIVLPYGTYLQSVQSTTPPFAIGIFTVYKLTKKPWWNVF